jgi:hypothetical protein
VSLVPKVLLVFKVRLDFKEDKVLLHLVFKVLLVFKVRPDFKEDKALKAHKVPKVLLAHKVFREL